MIHSTDTEKTVGGGQLTRRPMAPGHGLAAFAITRNEVCLWPILMATGRALFRRYKAFAGGADVSQILVCRLYSMPMQSFINGKKRERIQRGTSTYADAI